MIREAIIQGKHAFVLGSQLILPFRCYVLKITVGHETYTDLYQKVKILSMPRNTILVLRGKAWQDEVPESTPYVILVVAEEDTDLSEKKNHWIVRIKIGPSHTAPVEFLPPDVLYVE